MSEGVVRWVMGCPSGLVLTAALALVLVPAQYYVPELAPPLSVAAPAPPAPPQPSWLDRLLDSPPLELFVTVVLTLIGLFTYFCEWIQRKIMEKRIVKLNQYLSGSVARLRGWDSQQEQLETTLKLVQNATSEYNLLLYLMLRQHQHKPPSPTACPPSNCFFDKERDALSQFSAI